MAAAKEISLDAATVAVLSGSYFCSKKKKKAALEGFLGGQRVIFAFLPIGFGKSNFKFH